jgi:iron complex outermembrane receptor protein
MTALGTVIALFIIPTAVAAEDEEDDLLLQLGSARAIEIASGYMQPLSEAPSAATVITRAEMEAMGAQTVDDVLETVPGLHVSNAKGFRSIYGVRGVATQNNAELLIMVNNVPIQDAVTGGRTAIWNMPVQAMSRIEVIRGPGSAVHGGNAVSGVINIVTKNADETMIGELGGTVGSFDTYSGWLTKGHKGSDMDASFFAYGRSTNGPNRRVPTDAQTGLDAVFGSSASLSPGALNVGRDEVVASFDAGISDHWRIRGIYEGFRDAGVGVGIGDTLDPNGRLSNNFYVGDVTYQDQVKSSLITWNTYITWLDEQGFFQIFPPGAFGVFDKGVKQSVSTRIGTVGSRVSVLYRGLQDHTLRSEVGFAHQWTDKVGSRINYAPDPITGGLIPLDGFQSLSAVSSDLLSGFRERTIIYGLLQDDWRAFDDGVVTAGIRFDGYSDAGVSVSPRLSVMYDFTHDITAALRYGRAFRPPSFLENGSAKLMQGRFLDPETVDTVEIGVEKRFGTNRLELSGFWSDLKDLIGDEREVVTTPALTSFRNSGKYEVYGFELATAFRLTDDLGWFLNYSNQQPANDRLPRGLVSLPRHHVYTRLHWNPIAHWQFDARLNAVVDRPRATGVSKNPVKDYLSVGFTVTRTEVLRGLDILFRVENAFDADIWEPALSEDSFVTDIPLAGRSFLGQVRVRF